MIFVTGQLENVKRQLPGDFEKLPGIFFRCRICVFLDVELWLPLHSFSSNVDLNATIITKCITVEQNK